MKDEAPEACERHEIALERRLDGALGPEETCELEEHLAGCAACRRHARQIERIQTLLAASDAAGKRRRSPRPVTGHRVRRHVDASRDVARYSMATILCLGLGIVIEGFDESRGPSWLGLAAMLLSAVTIGAMAWDSRSMRRLAESREDVLKLSRSEVRTRRASVRALCIAMALMGVLALGSAFEHPPAWMPTLGTESHGALYLWLGVALVCASVSCALIVLPRLRRELAAYE